MRKEDATSNRQAAEHDPELVELSPAASLLPDAGAIGDILGDASIETTTKDDGRYVIYFTWPDDV